MSEAQDWQVDEVRDLVHQVITMLARYGANPHELRKQATKLKADLIAAATDDDE